MDVHLVDGTYELVRHFSVAADTNGNEVGAVRDVLTSVVGLIGGGTTRSGRPWDHPGKATWMERRITGLIPLRAWYMDRLRVTQGGGADCSETNKMAVPYRGAVRINASFAFLILRSRQKEGNQSITRSAFPPKPLTSSWAATILRRALFKASRHRRRSARACRVYVQTGVNKPNPLIGVKNDTSQKGGSP